MRFPTSCTSIPQLILRKLISNKNVLFQQFIFKSNRAQWLVSNNILLEDKTLILVSFKLINSNRIPKRFLLSLSPFSILCWGFISLQIIFWIPYYLVIYSLSHMVEVYLWCHPQLSTSLSFFVNQSLNILALYKKRTLFVEILLILGQLKPNRRIRSMHTA